MRAFIHILDDDLLLKIFHLCLPVLSDGDEAEPARIFQGRKRGQHWWYKLAHVCRRWRYLVLPSAHQLAPCLVCTYDTPVAGMLAHIRPLPIVVDYCYENRKVTAQDVEGILLALRRRRRVRRIRLQMPTSDLKRVVVAMVGEFPMLEYLYIKPLSNDDNGLTLPGSFKAPRLRHFSLSNIAYSRDMFHPPSPTIHIQPIKDGGEPESCDGSQHWRYAVFPTYVLSASQCTRYNRSLRMFVHILDDATLLKIIYLCRPAPLDKNDDDDHILQGGRWHRERWWYNLAHVCRRWRRLVFVSASHLGLSLLCRRRGPVVQMLAHSPRLPLLVDYHESNHDITTEDEEGLMLALQRRSHVKRIRLHLPGSDLQKIITAMDGEYPILEHLSVKSQGGLDERLVLPETFQAPHLRRLILKNINFQITSPLIATAMGLVTLSLTQIHSSAYMQPNQLIRQLSQMPQLEVLRIAFRSPLPNREVQKQLMEAPITTHILLPNLHWFAFCGVSNYLEALLGRMTAPSLKRLDTWLFGQLTYSLPKFVQFVSTTESFVFGRADIFVNGDKRVWLNLYPDDVSKPRAIYLDVGCSHLDWQVSSMSQILDAPIPWLSTVTHLSLVYKGQSMSSEGHNEVDNALWNRLLRPFPNVRCLQVSRKLVGDISNLLHPDKGESHIELCPELEKLKCSAVDTARHAFAAFIEARRHAGRPVTVAGL